MTDEMPDEIMTDEMQYFIINGYLHLALVQGM